MIMKLHDTTIRMFKKEEFRQLQVLPTGTSKGKLASPLGKIVSGIYLLKVGPLHITRSNNSFLDIYSREMYTKVHQKSHVTSIFVATLFVTAKS